MQNNQVPFSEVLKFWNLSGEGTKIEWAQDTMNLGTGCRQVSPGCDNCYAKTLAEGRLKHLYPQGFGEIKEHPERFNKFRRLVPTRWFVNSMSDFWAMEDDFILKCFEEMKRSPRHTFLILTKREKRMQKLVSRLRFSPQGTAYLSNDGSYEVLKNVWLGVSVENQEFANKRIPVLANTPAYLRFLSVEPLLGTIFFDYLSSPMKRIKWVIAGGESGINHRPVSLEDLRLIRDFCNEEAIDFFLKQIGGRFPKSNGRFLDGNVHEEIPTPCDETIKEIRNWIAKKQKKN